jgi:long-subunit acyl-CoA synthetase (AMP-forming)
MSLFARPRIAMQEREDGCLLLRSADPLQDYPGTIVHSLWAWAVADPDYPLVAQRGADGSWRACSYGAAVAAAAAIGQALLQQGLARDHLCALAWLNLAEARTLTGADIQIEGEFVVNEALHKALAHWLADHNDTAGSAARIERLAVLARPADLDFGEITDKGYVNQRQVLKNRSALIELLYADPPPAHVIIPGRTR